MELLEHSFNFDGSIEKYREYGLSSTSIINDLSCKEEILIIHGERFFRLLVLGPFEEEDEAVNLRFNFGDKLVILHTIDFLHLGRGCTKALDELSEDGRVRLDCAPLVEHI